MALSWDRWLTVGLLGAGAVIQLFLGIDAWVHRRADNDERASERLTRLEREAERRRDKDSEVANRLQTVLGDMQVRIAVIEQALKWKESA